MRPRTEVALAVGVVAALITVASATGRRARAGDDQDRRATTFSAGREGARALHATLERGGLEVVRWRGRPRVLASVLDGTPSTFVLLAPTRPLPSSELADILALSARTDGADLVIAGRTTERLVRCFGYRIVSTVLDSVRVSPPGERGMANAPWAHDHLRPTGAETSADSSRLGRLEQFACRVPPLARVDTLLASADGTPVVMRLQRADSDRRVLLVADADLLRNRSLRAYAHAPLLLDAVAGRSSRVVFDEYHHGFGARGSMLGVVLAWSRSSPFGWMAWQLTVVALLALAAAGVRFGPVRRAIPRTRRSSREHVRALATALAAARGHEVAIGAIVRGLRRRLAPAGRGTPPPGRDDWRPWLDSLARHAPTPGARASAEALRRAVDFPDTDRAVLDAANAVEDLWTTARP